MAANFDPYDRHSWFFGSISRQEATNILMNESDFGVFLVRNSSTMQGDLVLCVREDSKVSHYIINRVIQGDEARFRIGDQMFPDVPALLNFYKIYSLDSAPLLRPAAKKVERVRAKFDFKGKDAEDLPFKRGELLTVISKDEEQWWTARNSLGQIGSIPVPYVEIIDDLQQQQLIMNNDTQQQQSQSVQQLPQQDSLIVNFTNNRPHSTPNLNTSHEVQNTRQSLPEPKQYLTPNIHRKLPALAKVKQDRNPNAYDKTALKFKVGDIIKVVEMNINGQWKGEFNGKTGYFPFTHVDFIESENGEEQTA